MNNPPVVSGIFSKLRACIVFSIIGGAAGFACSADKPALGDGTVERTTAALVSPPTANFLASGTCPGAGCEGNATETSVVYQPGCAGQGGGNWVIGFNSHSTQQPGWARGITGSGPPWTATHMANALAFGNPGLAPDGNSLTGWAGDPALAPVNDPLINPAGSPNTRILYGNVAVNSAGRQDIIVAYSDDCGATGFRGAGYLSSLGSGGGSTAVPGGADAPVIATDTASPYTTAAVWWNSSPLEAWLLPFSYSQAGALVKGAEIQIPPIAGETIQIPAVAIGHVVGCNGASHEVAWVAFLTNAGASRCFRNPGAFGQQLVSNPKWYLTYYDLVDRIWVGPRLVATDPTVPQCIGTDMVIDNDQRPRLAADPETGRAWVAMTRNGDGWGTRVAVESLATACVSGSMTITPPVEFVDPDPCNLDPVLQRCQSGPGGTGTGGPGGGRIIQDEFGAAISFSYRGTSPRVPVVAATWNSMRDDTNNNKANAYMMYSENYSVTFTGPTRISVQTPSTAERLPYDARLWDWSDYQGLGTDRNGHFLAAWGGDSRLGTTNGKIGQIWTALLQ